LQVKNKRKMNIIIWVVTGVIAGWLAGLVVKGSGFGIIGDFIIGLIGGVLGGWLFGFLGVSASSWIGQVLVAALGGVVLVVVIRAICRV
jgi:uncharacterized membrane protein YeaQ/YmgE (transglycosylase-associated protein family)